ncbi:MAG: hypothetical protein AAFY30_15910 [Cyanobacteria bacterium J06642_12]
MVYQEALAKGGGKEETLSNYYKQLSVPLVIDRLQERRRLDLKVSITGRANRYLFGTTSSILNRFIVSQLNQLDPPAFEDLNCDLELVEGQRNDYRVTFKGRASEPFHEVIRRHGPRPTAMEEFNTRIWEDASGVRSTWRKIPQSLDVTCRPNWEVSPQFENAPLSKANCLIVRSTADATTTHSISRAVEDALAKLPTELASHLGTPLSRFSEEFFTDRSSLENAVKLLCNTEVVVFDATNFEPATMILLGIRAVVRRGVTIISIGGNYGIGDRISIPFNVEDANIVSHSKKQYESQDPSILLERRISRGIQQLATPYYLDLSVFDAIRNIAAEDRGMIAEEEGVLVLCPFETKYKSKLWEKQLQPGLQDQLHILRRDQKKSQQASVGVVRSFELESPRLVSQTIYEYIRRMQTCVIDWTIWSPNVFFEFGVRMASSMNRTSSVIERTHRACMESLASGDPAENWDQVKDDPWFLAESKSRKNAASARRIAIAKQTVKLLDFFDVIEYDGKKERVDNTGAFKEMYGGNALDHQSISIITSTNALVYRMVEAHLDVDSQPSARAVHQEMANSAASFGRDQSSGKPASLYPGNNALLESEQSAEFERLLATWFYLAGRYGADHCRQNDSLFDVFNNTVSRLMDAHHARLVSEESLKDVLADLKAAQLAIALKELESGIQE